MIVVDASVAAKWYLDEPGKEEAAALLDDIEPLAAPEIVGVEVASAIARRARLGQISADDALRLLAEWQASLDDELIRLESWRTDLEQGCRLACELRHALADCLYLAVAIRLDAFLVTADRTFARRAGQVWSRLRTL
jgi:predicted nucleic acid-binding protein